MVDRIVVALDGSELAERALGPARALAERLGARIRLVTTHWADGIGGAGEYLDRTAAALAYDATETAVLHDRTAPEAVALEAEQPDRIVCMATHGRSGLGQAVVGSVAEAVLRTVRAPVLLVGPELERGAWDSPQWFEEGRIVVAVDGSPASEAVLPAAADWSRHLRIPVELVRVLLVPLGLGPATPERADAQAALEELTRRVTPASGEATSRLLVAADVSSSLLEHIGANPTTLVAMTTHARTGVSRMVLGSVAVQVVRHSPCPVLVQRGS